MRAAIVSAAMGALGVALAFAGVRAVVSDRTRHLKENYRGRTVIATAGLVLVFPLGLGKASALAAGAGLVELTALAGAPFAMAILGFIDDLYGSRRAGGLLGHARELLRGHLTTGMLKAAGGALIGLGAAVLLGHRGLMIVVAGAVIALAANLANLLDLRPARTFKVWLPLAIALIVYASDVTVERIIASVAGGAVVFAVYELRETVMLGDTGANLLGATLGTGAVAVMGDRSLAICAAVLLAATLASEVVSFSRVIEAVPPLRWLDRLGRRGGLGE